VAAASSASSGEPARGGDKFASLAAQRGAEEGRAEALLRRRRDGAWEDLDRAEALTVKLLDCARRTAGTLAAGAATAAAAEATTTEAAALDRQLHAQQRDYLDTLQRLHGLLIQHAHHVKAYEQPARANRMYLQRVEWRLADSKRNYLKDALRLHQQEEEEKEKMGHQEETEQKQSGRASVGSKRKRRK
jgi:hypothetical protein